MADQQEGELLFHGLDSFQNDLGNPMSGSNNNNNFVADQNLGGFRNSQSPTQPLADSVTGVISPSSAGSAIFPDPNWLAFQGTPPFTTYDTPQPIGTTDGINPFKFTGTWDVPPPPQFVSHLPQRTLHQQPVHPTQINTTPPLYTGPMSDGSPVQTGAPSEGTFGPTKQVHQPSTGLSQAQREALTKIAMPGHLSLHSPKSDKDMASSPENDLNKSRKRKPSADDDDDDDEDGDSPQPKKTAHNEIEKRYRTNLNDKIAALRDSVPSLRIMSKSARGEDTTEDREELHGLTPAHKLNKATVLSKATEYIRHLEKRNNRLADENAVMQQRIAAFEQLLMHGGLGGVAPIPTTPPLQYPQDAGLLATPMATPRDLNPAGMIPVPEEMKRILQAQAATGRPYPMPQQFQNNPALIRQQQIQQQQQQQIAQNRWQNAGPYFGKLMVGSLAGLMILEAVREQEQSNETPQGRGLLALPIHLLRHFASVPEVSIAGYYFSAAQVLHSFKMLLLFGSLLWVFVPSLFAPSPPKSQKTRQLSQSLEAVPSLASPIHVRRQAWLTAIQTVWVPRHNFFLEAAALILKTMKLSLRNAIGIHGYQMLTGLTEEQEAARVKAWAIALDAQLAGGDVEVNKSRLTLTLLASGTLPTTPLRQMLKALHIRILCREVGVGGLENVVAAKLARDRWMEARQLNNLLIQLRKPNNDRSDDELPEHLALLLEQDCDDVLNDHIVQRAHNLTFNRPTTHNLTADIDGMNAVVEDPAVRSPMDAVAAWWSSLMLERVLVACLGEDDVSAGAESPIRKELELATEVAPIGSNAQIRALVARAVVIDEARGRSIVDAITAINPTTHPDKHPEYSRGVPPLIDSPLTQIMPDPAVEMTLSCAKAIAFLGRPSPAIPAGELAHIQSILSEPVQDMSLLSFTAAFKFMCRLSKHAVAESGECALHLERAAGTLRLWIGGPDGDACGLERDLRQELVERCLAVTRSIVGMESDPGYASMSDCEGTEC